MTFKHKLSRRLARLRYGLFAAVAALTACTDDPVQPLTVSDFSPAPNATIAFVIGDRVKVTLNPNVRSGPSLSATLLGSQLPGALGTIVGGPVIDLTGDRLERWNVDFDTGADGWVGEPWAGLTLVMPAIAVGDRVKTTGLANIRSGPALSATFLGQQPVGVLGTVVAGPVIDWTGDREVRWQVDYDQGVDGWAAQSVSGFIKVASGPIVASVTLTPATAAVIVGGTVQLTAVARDTAGAILTGAAMTWLSTDTLKAKVTAAGLVTGVAAGSPGIIATSGGKRDTTTVSVTAPAPPPAPTPRAGYYVATNGSSANDGSSSRPWTLSYALGGAGGRIHPGDTVWLRGGTYSGALRSTVTGAPGLPVVIRGYPGERAILDAAGAAGDQIVISGAWTVYWGFEVTNSNPTRTFSTTGNNERPNLLINNASNTKYINLVIHDGGQAVYNYPNRSNVEFYGLILYNNGWQAPDRGHGHALYVKSDVGPVVVRDNVIFNQFGYGIHAYTNAPSGGALINQRYEGNTSFNNGTLANNSTSANILMGGEALADAVVFRDNLTYFSAGRGATNVRLGYPSTSFMNGTLTVAQNYFAGGAPVLEINDWTTATISGNTLYGTGQLVRIKANAGREAWSSNRHHRDPLASAWYYAGSSYAFAAWKSVTGLAGGELATGGAPPGPQVIVRPNQYERGRAYVTVYNWSRQGSISADVSGVLRAGDHYEVRNVQALFGAPVASGTYGGGTISLPMTGVTPPVPIGMGSSPAPRTGPDFDVFVITVVP